MRLLATVLLAIAAAGCTSSDPRPAAAGARNLVIITIDTLRADRLGSYGYARARTPAIDALAARGARFERAFATAPITLTSHASLMTGLYPPGHAARHNGIPLDASVPTLAQTLEAAGFATGAFVGAFPLDRRFGLDKGFDAYGDRMPRGAQGRLANERPGAMVVDEALGWLAEQRGRRFFLWVHLFEPHAPYGEPADRRPLDARYDDEVAEADRQVGRLLDGLGAEREATLVVLASDHGEAFGEHGEIGHSIFVYDTTLRIPLIAAGPGIEPRVVGSPAGIIDVAPTAARLLGTPPLDADGIDLSPALGGEAISRRDLYAESFAPLLDFGWSPLRTMRAEGLKYIAAPKPELYDLARDPAETVNLIEEDPRTAAALEERVGRISGASLEAGARVDAESLGRLQALGYTSGRASGVEGNRPDPKDKRELAARIARVTSGELSGAALESALRGILADDPQNPQAHLRLGYVLAESNRCEAAEAHFRAAIAARVPTADAHLGLAGCHAASRDFDKAETLLRDALAVEPDNPVVIANQGVVLSDAGKPAEAIPLLERALSIDPDFHEARFNLAIAFARANRRADAARQARELLARMPTDAPQRAEVERLLAAVQ